MGDAVGHFAVRYMGFAGATAHGARVWGKHWYLIWGITWCAVREGLREDFQQDDGDWPRGFHC